MRATYLNLARLLLALGIVGEVHAVAEQTKPLLPTIYLIGDSTMADKPTDPPNPERGWGQALPHWLDPDAVRVSNHAMNGRSTKSFLDEGRWAKVVAALQPGDIVIIQFGHNDEKVDKPDRYAAPWGAYQENLRRFVKEARERQAMPILATPVARRKWSGTGELIDTHGDYPAAMRVVAEQQKVPLLELNKLTMELERSHGVEGSKRLHLHYPGGRYARWSEPVRDDTHYSEYGAERVAALAVQEILRLQIPPSQWVR